MSTTSPSTNDVDLLRTIWDLSHDQAPDLGRVLTLAALLERLLDCGCVVTLAEEAVRMLPRGQVQARRASSEIVLQCGADGLVRAEIALRRDPVRPFGEREVLLCEVLQPHLDTWFTRPGIDPVQDGRLTITRRQLEILGLVRCGMTNKEIARALGLSQGTVRKHLENAFRRLGVASRTAAVAAAFSAAVDVQDRHV